VLISLKAPKLTTNNIKSENASVVSTSGSSGVSNVMAASTTSKNLTGEGTNAFRSLEETQDVIEGGTTNIHSEAATKHVEMTNFKRDFYVETSLDEQTKHSIQSFLSRPYIITTGNLATTQAQNSSLLPFTTRVPTDVLPPIYTDKLQGFYGFKADFVVRLQVNANRFQQGRLLMYYFPWAQSDYSGQFTRFTSFPSLTAITQLPRVELDLSTETEVTLRIPYYSPFPYFPLNDTSPHNYDWAGFDCVIYSPLFDPSGSGGVDYTIWGHYENVDIVLPTMPFTPASFGGSSIEAQAGPISNTLSAVSKASGALSLVPSLKPFMTPLSWATGILAGTAQAFGFSKPSQEVPPSFQTLSGLHNYGNVNGEDLGKKLGLLADNEVAKLPHFGGFDIDEMSFEHMLSVPAFVNQYTWSTGQPEDTVLFNTPVGPISPGFCVNNFGAPSVLEGPAVSMLPRYFQYWRGGFRIKLKFVKTEFHSGRLIAAFAPAPESAALGTFTAENSNYLHRDIIDIRSSTEYEFTIPYVSIRPYSSVTQFIGSLALIVLNPLRAPSTVQQSVNILVEVSALPDFELAAPNQYFPYFDSGGNLRNANVTGPYSTTTLVAGPPPSLIEAQGGEPNDEEQLNLDRDIPMDNNRTLGTLLSPTNIQTIPAQVCIGERITSLRQMIRRFEPWSAPTLTTGFYAEDVPNNYVYTIKPWQMQFYNGLSGTTAINAISNGGSLQSFLSTMAGCYRFMRGSMRLKISPSSTNNNLTSSKIFDYDTNNLIDLAVSSYQPDVVAPPTDGFSFMQYGYTNQQYNKTPINGALEIEAPFYSYTPFIPTHYAENFFTPRLAYMSYPATATPDTGNFIVHRAAGDDFEFGFYTGFPPIVLSLNSTDTTVTVTGDYYINDQQQLVNPGFTKNTATNFPPNISTVRVEY